MSENYLEAGRRLYKDADIIFADRRFGTATHLFGLSAECALKTELKKFVGPNEKVRFIHFPKLADHARLVFNGRRESAMGVLLNSPGFMAGWVVDNRYWADADFDETECKKFRNHAWRTLKALGSLV